MVMMAQTLAAKPVRQQPKAVNLKSASPLEGHEQSASARQGGTRGSNALKAATYTRTKAKKFISATKALAVNALAGEASVILDQGQPCPSHEKSCQMQQRSRLSTGSVRV